MTGARATARVIADAFSKAQALANIAAAQAKASEELEEFELHAR